MASTDAMRQGCMNLCQHPGLHAGLLRPTCMQCHLIHMRESRHACTMHPMRHVCGYPREAPWYNAGQRYISSMYKPRGAVYGHSNMAAKLEQLGGSMRARTPSMAGPGERSTRTLARAFATRKRSVQEEHERHAARVPCREQAVSAGRPMVADAKCRRRLTGGPRGKSLGAKRSRSCWVMRTLMQCPW